MAKQPAKKLRFDEIGYWSEIKLDIIREYAQAYSQILSAQTKPRFYHVYIDAFAGAGVHLSKKRQEEIAGSPLNALNTDPPFREYHLIDLDGTKAEHLKEVIGDRPDVHVYEGNCNEILLKDIFPNVKYKDRRRGLCLLDPYGLHLNWEVIQTAGQMKSIEIFLNFPIMDMNRNVLWHDPEKVTSAGIDRMNAFWGDESWREIAYPTTAGLFGPVEEKSTNRVIAEAFGHRLKQVAGFSHVPEPMPMRNTHGAVVYYLFFASPNATGKKIVKDIFKKYGQRGAC